MNKRKKILILGVTGQGGSFMANSCIKKNILSMVWLEDPQQEI